ncbi:MAG: hypothetical protein V5A88_09190 [Candidatus Thermoplasmatota archaeon]
MPLEKNWPRIQRELNSLNLFYSAVVGKSEEEDDLRDLGFEDFIHPKFKDPYSERGLIEATPDFLLLRDDYTCFVEVKSGRNIDERHIEQSQRNSSFSIEGIRESFNRYLEISAEIRDYDSIFVYKKEYLEECINNEKCLERLEKIMEDSVVLSQERGGRLKFWNDTRRTSLEELNDSLGEGIRLPVTPKNEIMIVDDPEVENVVVYLIRKFNERLREEKEIVVSPGDIYREFIPGNIQCDRDRVKNAMEAMRELDAVTLKKGDSKYRVKRDDVGYLMRIPDVLREKDVDDILEKESGGLEDFGVEFE